MNEKVAYLEGEINARKLLLADTDYKCLKYAEGMLTDDEYATVKAQRQTWRDEINALEVQLEAAQAEAESEMAAMMGE